MNKQDILQQAVQELRKGKTVREVISMWPEHPELLALLDSVRVLQSLPTKKAPEPAMRRLFATATTKAFSLSGLLHILRFSAASTAAVLLVTAVTGTAFATFHSLPGQTLFPLKKQAERIQLHLTNDPVQKANIQVSIAQKRLADAEKVFNNPSKTSEQEIAALNELSKQTKETASSVKSVATASDHPIVGSFVDVTKKQQQLLSKISTDNEVAVAANSALEANQEATEIIAVVAATNDPGVLATANGSSTLESVTGSINAIGKNFFTVHNDTFYVEKQTSIKNFDGSTMDFSKLTTGLVVHVSAYSQKDELVAIEITAVDFSNDQGDVKGTSTPESASPTSTPVKTPEVKTPTSTKQNTTSTTPETDPNKATGTFIPEFP